MEQKSSRMNKILIIAAASAPLFCSGSPVSAGESADALMQRSDCLVCHKTDQKLVGPSFREIADRYKDDPNAVKTLTEKVINGGSGAWGQIPMAPHANIPAADAEEIVKWILEQKS